MKYRRLLSALLFSGLFSGLYAGVLPGGLVGAPSPSAAWATTCVNCAIVQSENSDTRDRMQDEHDQTREHFRNEFDIWEAWLDGPFMDAFYPPDYLMRMAHQLTVTAVYQVFAIGTLLDAKQSLESQRILQKKMAEATAITSQAWVCVRWRPAFVHWPMPNAGLRPRPLS